MSVLMLSNFISYVNDYKVNLCSHWLLNTLIAGLTYGGSGCEMWGFCYPLFTAALAADEITF